VPAEGADDRGGEVSDVVLFALTGPRLLGARAFLEADDHLADVFGLAKNGNGVGN
jgi:hypothetical protein